MKRVLAAAAVALAVSMPAITRADIVINAVETGGNVVFSFSGSIETSALGAHQDAFISAPGFSGPQGLIIFGASGTPVDLWPGGPLPAFGSESHAADSTAGAAFGFGGSLFGGTTLGMPDGYVSGSDISGSMTFLSDTFATLGLNPGTYAVDVGNDTVTLIIGPTQQVPAPATLALLGIGLAGVAFGRRRARWA